MKRLILIALIFVSISSFGEKMESYKASNGITYKVGDEIKLGKGSGQNGMFIYLILGGMYKSGQPEIPASYSGLTAVIRKIKSLESMQGKIVFIVHVDIPMNIANYELDIENAIKSCEIVDCIKEKPNTIIVNTPSKFDELKKLKELLDAGAITEQEYQTEKEKLLK